MVHIKSRNPNPAPKVAAGLRNVKSTIRKTLTQKKYFCVDLLLISIIFFALRTEIMNAGLFCELVQKYCFI